MKHHQSLTAWTSIMSDKDSINRQEKFETQRMMENYHWISIKSFWHDTPENDRVLEDIIQQKLNINKMLNDFQISLMEASKTNKNCIKLCYLPVINDNKTIHQPFV